MTQLPNAWKKKKKKKKGGVLPCGGSVCLPPLA